MQQNDCVISHHDFILSSDIALQSAFIAASIALIFFLFKYILLRRSFHELEETLQWHKLTINSSSLLFITADPNGYIRSINIASEKLLGYEEKNLINKETPALWHIPEEVVAHTEYLNKKYNTSITPGFETFVYEAKLNITATYEWTFKAKDSTLYPVTLSVHPLRNKSEKIIGFVGIIENLSQIKSQQLKIKEQEAKIISSAQLAALGEMAAGIAHEINNPLAIISGNASAIKKITPIEFTDIILRVDKIQTTVERISKIIKGMRTLTHNHNSKEFSTFDIADLVNDTLSICRERFLSHDVQLILDVPPSWRVHGNPGQLSQVLLNLLNNSYDAIQFLETKWIRLTFTQIDPLNICISVIDSGNGIPIELQKKIMEPFFTTKEVGLGVGIGLSISLQIMKNHRGNLELSTENKNTEFRITLPLQV